MKTFFITGLLVALFAIGCGTETGNPSKPKPGTPPPAATSSSGPISTALDQLTVALGGNDSFQPESTDSSLAVRLTRSSLALTAPQIAASALELDAPTLTSQCVQQGDTSVVTATASGTIAVDDVEDGRAIHRELSGKESDVRRWHRSNAVPLGCTADGAHVRLLWFGQTTLTVDATVDRSVSAKTVLAAQGATAASTRATTSSLSGTSTTSYSVPTKDLAAKTYTLRQELTIAETLKNQDTAADGTMGTAVSAKLESIATEPLVIESDRSLTQLLAAARRLTGGGATLTYDDGTKVELHYDASTLKRLVGCGVDDGAAHGTVTSADGKTVVPFKVTFTNGLGTVAADGEDAVAYVQPSCSFE